MEVDIQTPEMDKAWRIKEEMSEQCPSIGRSICTCNDTSFKDDSGNYIYENLIIDGDVVYEPEYEVKDIYDEITSGNCLSRAFFRVC